MLADPTRAEKFAAVVDGGKFVRGRVGDFLPVAEGVHDVIAQAGAAGGRRVGVPDELAVVLAGGEEHRKFPDAGVEGRVGAEVEGQAQSALRDFRSVEHHGTGAGGGHLAAVGYESIERSLFVFRD